MIVSVVVVCVVAAAGLRLTYAVTKDRIAAQDRAAEEKALQGGAPGRDDVRARSTDERRCDSRRQAAARTTPVDAVYVATDGSGEIVGWGVKRRPAGYGGPIRWLSAWIERESHRRQHRDA